MPELSLESLAKRVEALEAALAVGEPSQRSKGWRNAVGMFAGSEFMKLVDAEGERIREAEREAASAQAEAEGA